MEITPDQAVSETCIWAEDEDGNWTTDCGNMHIISEGTPTDNFMLYCCYCGKPLEDIPFKEDES